MRKIYIITFSFFFSLFSQAQTTMNKDSLLMLLKTKKDTALVKVYFDLAIECQGRDLTKAKEYSNKANKISKNIGFINGMINHYAHYSSFLDYEGKYDESIALNLKAVKLSIAKKDNYRLGCSYFSIAKTYQYKEDFTKSIIAQ